MRFSLTGLIRVSGLLILSTSAVAVAVSRLEPDAAQYRLAVPPRFDVVNGYVVDGSATDSRWLDTETGRTSPLALPTGDRIDYASCSPWQNEEGDGQLVGRWMHRTRSGLGMLVEQIGLARIEVPGGQVLDQIPLDVVPASQPCWFPGTQARVIFAASDGRLYRLDFDDADTEGASPTPVPIAWQVPAPGDKLILRDPIWPNVPRLAGRLIVSISHAPSVDSDRLTPGRLWWLSLDPSRSRIVAAGPLTDPATPGGSAPDRREERLPNVVVTPDNQCVLAYLSQPQGAADWDLHLAPLRFEPATDRPSVQSAEARLLIHDHLSVMPPFTGDGRHVLAIVRGRSRPTRAKFVRIPTGVGPGAPPVPRG